MRNDNNSQNLNFAAKIFLGAGAVCGVIGAFIPPVAIAAAGLALVGGTLEMAEAIQNKKSTKEEPRSKELAEFKSVEKNNTNVKKLLKTRTANKKQTRIQSI